MLIFPLHGVGDFRLLDLYFAYGPDQVYENLSMLGADGRSRYRQMALTSDLLFPISYSLALSIAMMLIFRRLLPPDSPIRHLCLFPFLTVAVDWCENLCLAYITHSYPEQPGTLIHLASTFTSLKWMLVITGILILFAGLAYLTIRMIRK